MSASLAILDYSVHGNAIDADSDRLLAAAATAAGLETVVQPIAAGREIRPQAERVWLRYDLRSRQELSWIVSIAAGLRRRGHRVYPPPAAILLAEDKWETYHALRAAAVPTLRTFLGLELDRAGLPLILKPRAGWGGQGNRVVRSEQERESLELLPAEDYIAQGFVEHSRTWIVPVAQGRELPAIEACREPQRDGDVRVLPLPEGGSGLGAAAVAAVGLPAGTVDLIESSQGPVVLEVNSAPRIPYPDLPGVDLATPLVRAVLEWLDTSAEPSHADPHR
ncbi:MAG: ATP-grasp domain-containing protein [Candidatus Anammoximicrobium sp.]|mgnify:CR=1 FL=1|nr:ATP-grasp domain-containing protein [Candidatus Anammoximicrobium sp.]